MSREQAPAITNLRYYKNETKMGNRTATPARNSIHYYSFGQGESKTRLQEEHAQRGTWYAPNGAEVSVPQMTEWVKESAAENRYTYTAVLSLRDGDMTRQDFINAMNKQDVFTDYRLITHSDTGHDHAHVMMFRDKTLSKAEFNTWRKTVGKELEKAESRQLDRQPKTMQPEMKRFERVDRSSLGDDLDHQPQAMEKGMKRLKRVARPSLGDERERDDDGFEMDR